MEVQVLSNEENVISNDGNDPLLYLISSVNKSILCQDMGKFLSLAVVILW